MAPTKLGATALKTERLLRGYTTCLLKCAETICSTESLFRSEITKLNEIFFKNGYSAWVFNEILNSFLILIRNS